uniref:ribosomal protein L6 n=1 Tax=Hypnea edeniana TaxID=1524265 RepID=UPI0023EFC161|nr:ribosomal protein L6 [Hypnea edeniana]WCH54782.1 ribosomal protein L6 [Hypnea edeniana]WDY85057.1 ribosomal protein L6 [Hypnea edeniana]
MSRIGKKSIILPPGIQSQIKESKITITGPKGELSYHLSEMINIQYNNNKLQLSLIKTDKESKALYGLSRTIINNMVIGVSKGFEKKLEIRGVGYRCQMNENNLILNIGYSHPVIIKPPKDISIQVEDNVHIIISGINKEKVGQVAAKIRSTRPPEPYKQKGIRYSGEIIRKKVGKAGK